MELTHTQTPVLLATVSREGPPWLAGVASHDAAPRVADHVRWTTLNRRSVILCLRTGSYFGLNEVGARIWRGLVEEQSASDICADVARCAGIEPARVRADYDAFTGMLRRRGLLADGAALARDAQRAQTSRVAARLPSLLHAWLCQQRIAWRLRSGFAAAYRFAACTVAPARGSDQIARCLASFAAAEKFTGRALSRDDCLARSLALFVYLRARGFSVRHVIGIADDPLRAHAWVELDGAVLLDDAQHVRRHFAIAQLP